MRIRGGELSACRADWVIAASDFLGAKYADATNSLVNQRDRVLYWQARARRYLLLEGDGCLPSFGD
eukprot:8975619-Lingulodinium_polyedra.AAC.1